MSKRANSPFRIGRLTALSEELWATNKPAGVATHAVHPTRPGAVELLSQRQQKKFYPCHRLDKETSGILLLAESKAKAATTSELFARQQVEKYYYLVVSRRESDRLPSSISHQSRITKQRGRWRSSPDASPNSSTQFDLLERGVNFCLWQAQPKTGKTHQIRLHAQDLGIPIVGDTLYGGKPYPRLLLHACKMVIPHSQDSQDYSEKTSLIVEAHEDLISTELPESDITQWRTAIERRRWLFGESLNTKRWIHQEAQGKFTIDQYGSVLWVHNFALSSHATKRLQQQLLSLLSHESIKHVIFQEMKNRGQSSQDSPLQFWGESPPEQWEVLENGLKYWIRRQSGLSPGLFLDQRHNRRWLLNQASQKTVLNLFAYTCGFSLCAASGGASRVVSVDVSRNYLEWGKDNFTLNHIDPDRYEFVRMDSLEYLRYCQKKGQSFDFIVCDPPSFGRHKKKVFRLAKDLPQLIDALTKVLAHRGRILLSTNYEKWSNTQFENEVKEHLPPNYVIEPTPLISGDFELPGEATQMKSLFIDHNPGPDQ